jgi:hypothetical protein
VSAGAKTPIEAVEFLRNEAVDGKIFNSDEFGNYMIYAGGLECELFCDGRDMIGEEQTADYLEIINVGRGWKDALEKYDVSWVVHNTDSRLSTVLMEREDWALVFSDAVASVFAKRTPANERIIDKYPNVKRAVTMGGSHS